MNPVTCIITEDEPMARKGLKGYVSQIRFLELAGVCENIADLKSLLSQRPVDLLFLDIEMPGLSGIDYLRTAVNPPAVIFTTAYEKYAVNGFELGVLDYLLKPVSFDRFLKGCNKAYDYFSTGDKNAGQDYFFVKTGLKLEKCLFEEILLVEAMQNYVSIVMTDRKLMVHSTLKSILQQLPADRFMAVHKSFIVQLSRVSAVEGNILHVGREQVPVSKTLKDEVINKIVRRGTGLP